jgi:hypothetical protein
VDRRGAASCRALRQRSSDHACFVQKLNPQHGV